MTVLRIKADGYMKPSEAHAYTTFLNFSLFIIKEVREKRFILLELYSKGTIYRPRPA